MFALLTLGILAIALTVIAALACTAASVAGNVLQIALFPLAAGATIFALTVTVMMLAVLVSVGTVLAGLLLAFAIPILLIGSLIGAIAAIF